MKHYGSENLVSISQSALELHFVFGFLRKKTDGNRSILGRMLTETFFFIWPPKQFDTVLFFEFVDKDKCKYVAYLILFREHNSNFTISDPCKKKKINKWFTHKIKY